MKPNATSTSITCRCSSDGQVMGNLVITLDFTRYFSRVFAKYNLEQYQWQWVVNDTGTIVFDNHGGEVIYTGLKKITEDLDAGKFGEALPTRWRQAVRVNEILSAFYPVNILGARLWTGLLGAHRLFPEVHRQEFPHTGLC
ncbi:MAG: cache domain-containing protein [Marinilabiliales bacterium]|nr:cache domain-containing protein [Marinilabiliales bacterium]